MQLLIIFSLACRVAAIWPAPQSYTHGSSTLWIEKDVEVTYNGRSVRCSAQYTGMFSEFWESHTNIFKLSLSGGRGGPSSNSFTSEDIVTAAVQRAYKTIFSENFIPWKLYPRNEIQKFEPSSGANKTLIKCLEITQTGIDTPSTFKPLAGQVDESYSLSVGMDGSASITAASSIGVLYALQTFTQLFYLHSSGHGIYTNLAPIIINDSPRFQHRGLNIDVARNWYPKGDILRTIDALSYNKFNRLHIHMTDGQSWPMDIPAFPELSQEGAYQYGLTYSTQDIADIQKYAVYRGVEVIVEFDMPGHTSSIGLSHPELLTAYKAKPWDKYCAEPPCGSLKLNSTAVSKFLKTLFDDVLPRVKPYSSYFHSGGDEVNLNAYLLDETVKSNLPEVLRPLMQNFVDRNHAQIRAAGLAPIVWEEMALDWNLTLGKDVVVQTWLSEDSIAKVADKGYNVLFGNYNFWYLDCGKGQWLNFAEGESFKTYYPFNDYCSPTKSWRYIYSYDPTARLTAAQKALVLGGEVHIWSEQTDPINLDDIVWPRASAAGEVLWSGRQDAQGNNRTQLDASPRLAEMRERMVARGIRSGPVHMVFCTQADSTECSL